MMLAGRTAPAGIALAAILAGCSPPPALVPVLPASPSATRVEDYFPLTPDSRWTYRVRDLAKAWTYETRVRVFPPRRFDFLGRDGIPVEERYSSVGGPLFVEEQEPIVYYRDEGFLHRVYLTYQAGQLVPQSGSRDSRHLPEVLRDGTSWDSETTAFRVGGGLGIQVVHHHEVHLETDVVSVPAGDFTGCIRIDTYSSHGAGSDRGGGEIAFWYSDWYAPGIGLVRTQQWDDVERREERSKIELLEASIAEPAGSQPP